MTSTINTDFSKLQRFRIGLVVLAAITGGAQVVWQSINGGVMSHHIWHRAELPAISNW